MNWKFAENLLSTLCLIYAHSAQCTLTPFPCQQHWKLVQIKLKLVWYCALCHHLQIFKQYLCVVYGMCRHSFTESKRKMKNQRQLLHKMSGYWICMWCGIWFGIVWYKWVELIQLNQDIKRITPRVIQFRWKSDSHVNG